MSISEKKQPYSVTAVFIDNIQPQLNNTSFEGGGNGYGLPFPPPDVFPKGRWAFWISIEWQAGI
jgi:hypothetical protein